MAWSTGLANNFLGHLSPALILRPGFIGGPSLPSPPDSHHPGKHNGVLSPSGYLPSPGHHAPPGSRQSGGEKERCQFIGPHPIHRSSLSSDILAKSPAGPL